MTNYLLFFFRVKTKSFPFQPYISNCFLDFFWVFPDSRHRSSGCGRQGPHQTPPRMGMHPPSTAHSGQNQSFDTSPTGPATAVTFFEKRESSNPPHLQKRDVRQRKLNANFGEQFRKSYGLWNVSKIEWGVVVLHNPCLPKCL